MRRESLLTSWVLLLWQEANFLALFPLPVFAEIWTASSSVPVKQCTQVISNGWFLP